MTGSRINAKGIVAPKSFSPPESVLDIFGATINILTIDVN
jgi:hypothetical protein